MGTLSRLVAILIVLAGCSASPIASSPPSVGTPPSSSPSTPSPNTSLTTSETAAPTASPSAPLLASTTESLTEAPAGSVEVEIFGPPPQFREETYVVAAGEAVFFLRNTSPDLIHATHALAIGAELGGVEPSQVRALEFGRVTVKDLPTHRIDHTV